MSFTNPTTQRHLATHSDANGHAPPPAYSNDPSLSISVADIPGDGSDSDGEDEDLPTIQLRINAPITITGDHNLVALDPSESASKIAVAVVTALKQISMGGGGVPMIDEEGRPRPIKVEVIADTRVQGSKNVIGETAVISTLVSSGWVGKMDVGGGEGRGRKRERAGSEPVKIEEKRVRIE